jgi:hypothetical protein
VAAGLGALGTTWVAQQATAAAATTVDAVPSDPLPGPSTLPTAVGKATGAPTKTLTAKSSTAKAAAAKAGAATAKKATAKATARATSATARATATRPPVVRVTAPPAANPVHAGTHSS